MDWDNVKVFLAVARAGQLSAAATALRLDISTVGRRMVMLEKCLGARLFDRTPTGSVLTAAGENLLGPAQEIESLMIRAQCALSGADSEMSGTVRIAAPDAFTTLFLCSVLPRLMLKHPMLTIQLVPISRALSLSRREADLAILVDRPSEGRLAVRRLVDYSLHFYATKNYLRQHARPLSKAELSNHVLVTYVQDLLFDDQLKFMAEMYSRSHRRFECATALAQIAVVRASGGIGILPDYAIVGDDELEVILPNVSFGRSYWMAIHEDFVGLNRVQVVVDHIVSELKLRRAGFRGAPLDI
ncbi:LysR family transcriptional regulator [Rhodopseudomonas sp. P2A-2r]|uniref:LysR family transcriptional regulator n=1 Tax=unclassified Rhodopseudomonas TaxID=2638247 RepID=UPI00223403F7|nr:LysR family transcriptional regulator [Rhodopseudomonas sp. P2A-2r]UZE51060.1 LysR family transcriptional regulator [Rhodopseudomonas sp. P2A-2r]